MPAPRMPQADNRLEPQTGHEQEGRCPVHGPLKLLGYIIVLLMIVAALYSVYMAVTYWSGIAV